MDRDEEQEEQEQEEAHHHHDQQEQLHPPLGAGDSRTAVKHGVAMGTAVAPPRNPTFITGDRSALGAEATTAEAAGG